MRYVSPEGARNVKRYRYAGGDGSLVYRWFCSPLAEALVQRFVPIWMAPNLITCLGLAPSLLAHGVVCYYCADLKSRCPSWCWALAGVCTFAYQTLDNMDGKQARRSGSSSPLGLLLDHGADALNIVLSALNVMALLQAGDSWAECAAIWLASSSPFFFATWEEYHTGALFLGFFNGPTDGVLILCASQIASACVDDYARSWRAELAWGVPRKVAMIWFYVICVLATVTGNVVAVVRATHGQHSGRHGRSRLRDAFEAVLPFCLMNVLAVVWLASPGGNAAFVQRPRLVVWVLGLLFLKLVTHLQLAHICGEPYRAWRKTLLVPLALLAGNAVGGLFGQAPADEVVLLWVCAFLVAASWVHMAWCSVQEIAVVLGIRVFSISPAL